MVLTTAKGFSIPLTEPFLPSGWVGEWDFGGDGALLNNLTQEYVRKLASPQIMKSFAARLLDLIRVVNHPLGIPIPQDVGVYMVNEGNVFVAYLP